MLTKGVWNGRENEEKTQEAKILYRTTVQNKKLLDEAAKSQKMILNDFIDQGVSFRLACPPGAYESLQGLATEMHLPIPTIIFAKIAKQIAWEFAWLKVFGRSAPSTSVEFRFEGNRLVTGDELMFQLLEEFETLLTSVKAKIEPVDRKTEFFSAAEMESVVAGLKSETN